MSNSRTHLDRFMLDRRHLLAAAAGLVGTAAVSRSALAAALQDASDKTGVDPTTWTPERIQELAGTVQVDTAAEVHAVVPADVEGDLIYWNVGPNQASPQIDKDIYDQFQTTFPEYYPSIALDNQNQDYNGMLDKVRTAAEGGAGPDVAKMPILWGVEFAARGQLQKLTFEEFGFTAKDFWPGAIKSVTWQNDIYGIPTNNETMAFIWNRAIFERAGLDPETGPATWADVVEYSRIIKEETGKNGYGMVAKVNAGNTPFRFMPMLWAYGSGALDEAEPNPEYRQSMINNEGGIAALQAMHDMYVTDRSVPTSALTNTQTENQDLFIAGEIAMMISHPSEYVAMRDRAENATGSDKERADEIVANMAYGLIPEGPVRRAVVFGGSNIHILTDEAAGHEVNRDAARALITTLTHPEWSTKFAWTGSNPGNLRGFETEWMKERLDTISFLEVTTAMLPYGIPFPVVPESTEIMNIIVPEMLQNALTQSMTVEEAANDAAEKINALVEST